MGRLLNPAPNNTLQATPDPLFTFAAGKSSYHLKHA
jgi:hypothetical protein